MTKDCTCIIINSTPLVIVAGCLEHDTNPELCEMCDSNPRDGGRLCDSCRTEWKESDSE